MGITKPTNSNFRQKVFEKSNILFVEEEIKEESIVNDLQSSCQSILPD